MRGNLVNLSFKVFNKQSSVLVVKYPKIPHYAYSSRCGAFETTNHTNINSNLAIIYDRNKKNS